MARAGGQILKDVLRRKLSARQDQPMYDDQGQTLEADGVKRPMRNPNPDGTFDGPSGGRPVADNYGDAPSDLEMRDEEDMDMEPDGDADDEGDFLLDIDGAAERFRNAANSVVGTSKASNFADEHNANFGAGARDAVLAEAEKMGAEGLPIQVVIQGADLDDAEADEYNLGEPDERTAAITAAYNRGKQRNVSRGMGKPTRPGQ